MCCDALSIFHSPDKGFYWQSIRNFGIMQFRKRALATSATPTTNCLIPAPVVAFHTSGVGFTHTALGPLAMQRRTVLDWY